MVRMDEVIIGYYESMFPLSHIGMGLTHYGVYSHVRGKKCTYRIFNKFLDGCELICPNLALGELGMMVVVWQKEI